MKKLFKIIDWVKNHLVALWAVKILFALIVGAISFLVFGAVFDAPTGFLLTFAIVYAYLGFQIANNTKAKNKEPRIFGSMAVILIFLSIIASILGFIFISKAFGWMSILLLMFSVAYLILRALNQAEKDAKEALERFLSMTE